MIKHSKTLKDNILTNKDTIFINNLKIKTYVGIYDWEQKKKQTIIVDLHINADLKKAAYSNDINDTINYQKIYNAIINFVENNKFQLIENLAEQITSLLLENFPIEYVKLQLTKPKALKKCSVGIIIERNKNTK